MATLRSGESAVRVSDDICYCFEDDEFEQAARVMASRQVRRFPLRRCAARGEPHYCNAANFKAHPLLTGNGIPVRFSVLVRPAYKVGSRATARFAKIMLEDTCIN
jgi:hypothetical protein